VHLGTFYNLPYYWMGNSGNFARSCILFNFGLPGTAIIGKKQILLTGFCFLLICSPRLFSQTVLKGRVISEESQKPLASISVYINNTSLGAVTNEDGIFIIRGVPSGQCRLVASSVGFETYVGMIDPQAVGKDFTISLKPQAEQLEGFSVRVPDPEGWKNIPGIEFGIAISKMCISMHCNITRTCCQIGFTIL
jgi:hypothetical protein